MAAGATENTEGPEDSLFIPTTLPTAIKPKRRKGSREAWIPVTGLRGAQLWSTGSTVCNHCMTISSSGGWSEKYLVGLFPKKRSLHFFHFLTLLTQSLHSHTGKVTQEMIVILWSALVFCLICYILIENAFYLCEIKKTSYICIDQWKEEMLAFCITKEKTKTKQENLNCIRLFKEYLILYLLIVLGSNPQLPTCQSLSVPPLPLLHLDCSSTFSSRARQSLRVPDWRYRWYVGL